MACTRYIYTPRDGGDCKMKKGNFTITLSANVIRQCFWWVHFSSSLFHWFAHKLILPPLLLLRLPGSCVSPRSYASLTAGYGWNAWIRPVYWCLISTPGGVERCVPVSVATTVSYAVISVLLLNVFVFFNMHLFLLFLVVVCCKMENEEMKNILIAHHLG